MKNPILYSILFLLILSSCKKKEATKQEGEISYTWKDDFVYSFTDIHNPFQGFTSVDKEALERKFADFIISSVENSSLSFTDIEGNPISQNEAKGLLVQSMTVFKQDNEDPEEFLKEEKSFSLKAEDIVQVVCREEWYFEENNFSLSKRIKEIAPVVYSYDKDGDVRGKKMLFWIKLN